MVATLATSWVIELAPETKCTSPEYSDPHLWSPGSRSETDWLVACAVAVELHGVTERLAVEDELHVAGRVSRCRPAATVTVAVKVTPWP